MNPFLTVKNVQFEFEEGFILNIVVETVDHAGRVHLFANPYSIGFASMYNLSVLNRYYLKQINRHDELTVIIRLADVVRFYRPHLRPLTRDYSPRDGSFTFVPQSERIKLFKEETQKLLEARVYSDFIGLNQEKPNGLIQTEISKRINTNTERVWLPVLLGRRQYFSRVKNLDDRIRTLRANLEQFAHSNNPLAKKMRADSLRLNLMRLKKPEQAPVHSAATNASGAEQQRASVPSALDSLAALNSLQVEISKVLYDLDLLREKGRFRKPRQAQVAIDRFDRDTTSSPFNRKKLTSLRDRLRNMQGFDATAVSQELIGLKTALDGWEYKALREKHPGGFWFWRTVVDPLTFILGEGAGAFQYVTPVVTLSKLEENNKRLPMSRLDGSKGKSYLTALDVLQYQNFSAGLDANLLYFDNMSGKYNLTLDGRLRFGRTALTDSLSGQSRRDFSVNSVQVGPEVKMQWFPDERFGFSITRRWNYTTVLSNEIDQQGVYQRETADLLFKPLRDGIWISTWELSAFLKPSENGKLFFRYRLIHQGPNHQEALFGGNRQANFQQAQIGYSFYLLRNRKGSEDRGGR